MSPEERLEGLKSAVKSVLESNPEILDGKKIVFSENCGRKDVEFFKEFETHQENTVKVLIFPNKYGDDTYRIIMSDNFRATHYYSKKIRTAIKEKFGYDTLATFDHFHDDKMILWTVTF